MIKVVCLESGDFSTMIKNENNIPVGYKDSAVGIIPQEWEVKNIEEICDIYVGRDVQKNHFKEIADGKYKYPVYSNTVEDKGLYGYYDYEEYENNTVTVVGRGIGLGTAFARDNGYGAIGRLIVLKPHSNMNNHFLSDYINAQVHFYVESAAIPQLTGEQIATYKVVQPSKEEQQKIVEILRTWDEAIEKQTKLIKALEKRKQALMQRLLSGRTRLPGFTGEWKHIRIENIANEYSIRNHEQSNLTVLSCTKYNGLVSSLDYFGKQIYSNDLSSYKLVPKNHFAYATNHIDEGSIGYQSDYDEALISPMYTVFRTNNKIVNDNYMCMLLKTDYMIYKYKSLMEGSIDRRGGLHWKSFASIEVKLPSLEEQIAIANILVSADDEIKRHNTKLSQLRKQKRGLMQQLLTGKKRVK